VLFFKNGFSLLKSSLLFCGKGKKINIVLKLIKKIAENKKSKMYVLKDFVKIEKTDKFFNYKSDMHYFKNLQLNLNGNYQIQNASLAIFSLECINFEIKEVLLKTALLKIKWEGRYEKIKTNPLFIIDGAHNPAGAEVLAKNIKNENYSKLVLIISVMSDKNIDDIFKNLLPLSDTVIFTKAKLDRAADFELLKIKGENFNNNFKYFESVSLAIKEAENIANKDDLILFTGSLYAVGEAKEFLGNINSKFTVGNKYK